MLRQARELHVDAVSGGFCGWLAKEATPNGAIWRGFGAWYTGACRSNGDDVKEYQERQLREWLEKMREA
jgi:hypothetical protein